MTAPSAPSAHRAGTSDALPPAEPSLGANFLAMAARQPDAEAFRSPDGDGWQSWSWQQVEQRARALAAGLLSLGVGQEDRVAIASSTRLEWVLADLAVMLAGGAVTTVYPSSNADDVAYIVADSGSVVVIAEDAAQVAKLASQRARLGGVRRVVVIDAPVDTADGDWVITLDELAEAGRALIAERPRAVDEAVSAVTPDRLATVVYTSGTTGRPKGVELTHGNWLYEGRAIAALELLRPDHLQFLWLPLSHVFGKVLLSAQYQVGFRTAVDGRVDRIVDNLAAIRPTFMAAAPRIFEKVHARVVTTAESEGRAKAAVLAWASRAGIETVRREADGRPVPPLLALQRKIADRLVFAKIRARLGGRIEYLVSGSAALSAQVAEWFAAIGLPVLEGYGLTETSAAAFVNRPGQVRVGTVGPPLPGTEVRIAEDGEVLLRGPGVMRGYHGLPAETAAVLDREGWLATGDVGELDEAGRLRITDRKKDLAKTSGGKYVAPSAIEGALKAACPLLSNAVVIADGRNYATALVSLDPDTAGAWARAHDLPVEDVLAGRRDEVRSAVREAVDRVNGTLNRWETVKDFRILPRELTVEAGEITPSLKVKRRVVTDRYADLIGEMYPGG